MGSVVHENVPLTLATIHARRLAREADLMAVIFGVWPLLGSIGGNRKEDVGFAREHEC